MSDVNMKHMKVLFKKEKKRKRVLLPLKQRQHFSEANPFSLCIISAA